MAKVKKILFIHHNSTLGGAELSLADLVTNLSDDIIPICALPEGPLREKLSAVNIKIFTVPMRALHRSMNPFYWLVTGFRFLRVNAKLKKICRQEDIELIHANCLTAALYAKIIIKSTKIPLLWHERDLVKHSFLAPRVAKFAKYIIAISHAVAENLKQQLGNNNNIKVIYNGIDLVKFDKPSSSEVSDFPKDKQIVLMVAQFVSWKKHMDFIKMALLVKKQIPDTVFVLAGDRKKYDQQEYIQQLERSIAKHGLEQQFIWTGFIEDMPRLLKNIDCVVLPATCEPFGRIVVEAMAAGKPVVAVNSGAIPEIIEDGISGCLVNSGDFDAMSKSVCQILKDKVFADKIVEQGKLRVSQNFTIQRTVAKFEKLVKEILD
jgi:glycosyltransferase involved in cell wall biosynthesis